MNPLQFYIDGAWTDPIQAREFDVVDPADETAFTRISLGSAADVDRAVAAARRAFESYGRSSRQQRLELLAAILASYEKRQDELAQAISREMGAPITLARRAHVAAGRSHFEQTMKVLEAYDFDEPIDGALVTREPVGVCGLITPWNWPLNQIACKVAPALAAGCTVVLKPSEVAPLSALVFAQVLHDAGVPAGVFNLVNGDGPSVGEAMARHPGIDMMSFTGSTQAGVLVAQAAAATVKRVTQELGGKSPNIILDDADFEKAVGHGARLCFNNSGQSCNAPTRMLVPATRQAEAAEIARRAAQSLVVGPPADPATTLGPVANRRQFEKIQGYLERGTAEGATLVVGGPGRPPGLERGYFVRPTVFAGVDNGMTIGREEIFGPVLSILPYGSEDEAVAIANDTEYGLAAYVTSGSRERAMNVARRIRSGTVHINGAPASRAAPFGGMKRSGNGREWGRFGFEEFLEIKAIFG